MMFAQYVHVVRSTHVLMFASLFLVGVLVLGIRVLYFCSFCNLPSMKRRLLWSTCACLRVLCCAASATPGLRTMVMYVCTLCQMEKKCSLKLGLLLTPEREKHQPFILHIAEWMSFRWKKYASVCCSRCENVYHGPDHFCELLEYGINVICIAIIYFFLFFVVFTHYK